MENNSKSVPLISVVMPTYNGELFIREAIDSILSQTFTNFEFIIVDDGSTDSTSEIINSYNDERILYLKKEINSGIADSLNLGISKACGVYIARMDDDDVSKPERFEKQLHVFNTNPELIFCGTNVMDKDGKPNNTPEFHEDILLKFFFFKNPIFHPTAIVKREVLLKHPYIPDMVPAEDHDLWSRLIFEGQFYQIQEPLFYVRLHQTSTTARRRQEQLMHNITISKRIFDVLGFERFNVDDECIEIFASHNYAAPVNKLKQLVNWIESLKIINLNKHIFDADKFNIEADLLLKRYLKSYFLNNSISKKTFAFLNLRTQYKMYIFKYYWNKLF